MPLRSINTAEVAVLERALGVCPTPDALPAHTLQLRTLTVESLCACGCDTVNFTGRDTTCIPAVIADGLGVTSHGVEVGLLVFGTADTVTCLEVYSFGDEPGRLPTLDSIRPFEKGISLPPNNSLERSRDG